MDRDAETNDPLNSLELENARVRETLDALDSFTVDGKTYRIKRDLFGRGAFIREISSSDNSEPEVFDRAFETWGAQPQIDKGIEECGELIAELARYQNGQDNGDAIRDEIADVLVMARQLRSLFGPGRVDEHQREKIERLEQRLVEANADE